MIKKALFAVLSAGILFSQAMVSFQAHAELAANQEQSIKKQINEKLGLTVTQVQEAPMPGLFELITEAGLFYSDVKGDFFIQGKLYGLTGNVVNHSESTLSKMRLDGIAKFANDMIVYPAKNEKHVITVFTDITCTYCRKMHKQMDAYNNLGITVRYLAYPRYGIVDKMGSYTQSFKDLRSIWCHEQPAQALTKAKDGGSVAARICDKPIEAEFNFGRQVGVSGTPAIVLNNGQMLSGFRPPEDMIAVLESM